jgi:omega-amidase
MANKLGISLVQYDIAWESAELNRQKIESLLSNAVLESHVIILPEMFHCGFTMKPSRVAQTMDGEVVCWMKSLSNSKNAIILGSLVISENGKYYNRLLAVSGQGVIASYDKRHLFRMAGEDKIYAPGHKPVVVSVGDWRIALFICYDIRFPVWIRNRNNYDLAIFVANWPASRSDIWKTLLKARAIENQCYVAGVNRLGKDGSEAYTGDSMLVDFNGNVIESLPEKEGVVHSYLNLSMLQNFRKQFPAWMDADTFQIDY